MGFIDVDTVYTRPARTLAAYNQANVELLRKVPRARALAEIQFGPDPDEWEEWIGFEAVLNRSFAHISTWVWCTYDANGLPDRLLEAAWRTYSHVSPTRRGPRANGSGTRPSSYAE